MSDDNWLADLAKAVMDAKPKPTVTRVPLSLLPERHGSARGAGGVEKYALLVKGKDEPVKQAQVMYTVKDRTHMDRFSHDQMEFEVPIVTKKAEFEDDAEWIATQAKSGWSVRVDIEANLSSDGRIYLDDPGDRKHTVIYSFETKEDAALFKMFRT